MRRRTRTFRPNYLSFAGTYQCNLTCPHCCVPIEWPDRLDIAVALRFLEDAHAAGVIGILGFTGGEPFLYPEFVIALTRRAAELGFRFDKIMTNGVWYRDADHLAAVLTELRNAGFSGKLGLSVDKFHGIAHRQSWSSSAGWPGGVFGATTSCRCPTPAGTRTRGWSRSTTWRGSWTPWSNGPICCGRYLLVSPDLTMTLNWNHLAPVERAEQLTGAWDGALVRGGLLRRPGPGADRQPARRGEAVLRFRLRPRPADDRQHLPATRCRGIIRRARRHPYVGKVFREGLTAIRDEILARDPDALPGATSNHCYFCWYVLTRGLAAGVNGGGGQVGDWTGERPNYRGGVVAGRGDEAPTAARGFARERSRKRQGSITGCAAAAVGSPRNSTFTSRPAATSTRRSSRKTRPSVCISTLKT